MRQVAEVHPLVEFRNGSAEATKLSDKSVDLVTCFQAFHWFNLEPTLKEFARMLKAKGKIALLWNDRDVDGDDQFTCEHNYIITQASNKSPILSRLAGYLLIPSFLRSIIIFFPINKLSLKMLLLV